MSIRVELIRRDSLRRRADHHHEQKAIGNFGMSKDEEFRIRPGRSRHAEQVQRRTVWQAGRRASAAHRWGCHRRSWCDLPVYHYSVWLSGRAVVGSVGSMVGLYMLLNDLFRPKPNTTVIFPIFDGKDIISSYPDWDNPEAEELVRNFARVKRGTRR